MCLRQKLAIASAPLVTVTMIPVFRFAGSWLRQERGWFVGMLVYWIVWCGLVPFVLIGPRAILDLFRHRRMSPVARVLVALPPVLSLAARPAVGGRSGAVGV